MRNLIIDMVAGALAVLIIVALGLWFEKIDEAEIYRTEQH